LKEAEVDACYCLAPGLLVCAELLQQLVERHRKRELLSVAVFAWPLPFYNVEAVLPDEDFLTKTNLSKDYVYSVLPVSSMLEDHFEFRKNSKRGGII